MIHETNEFFDNSYAEIIPNSDDYVICVENGKVLVSYVGEKIIFPTIKDVEKVSVYLFSLGAKRFFLGSCKKFGAFGYVDFSTLRDSADKDSAFAAVTGVQLHSWYEKHTFCGKCSAVMRHSKVERALVCSCGNVVYPQISPAVIVAVTHNGRICLTKYNRGYAKWALVAGYNEVGETVEQTVHREVFEEVGLRVKNLRYYKSQPWGFSSSMLLGFFCEVDGNSVLKVDGDELKEAKWFLPDEIDFDNDGVSLTREMIAEFKRLNK